MRLLSWILLIVFAGVVLFTNSQTKEPFDGTPEQRCKYLEDMVKYLTLVVKMNAARQDVYKLSHGYARTFGSPKLDALEKQRQYFLAKIKKDPQEIAFFRENLTFAL